MRPFYWFHWKQNDEKWLEWIEYLIWNMGWREIKYFFQRSIRGFDESDLWSLDHTIVRFVLPRLIAFRNLRNGEGPMGFPCGLLYGWDGNSELSTEDNDAQYNEWLRIIDAMIWSMQNFVDTEGMPGYTKESFTSDKPAHFDQALHDKWEEGMNYFHKYFHNLWD